MGSVGGSITRKDSIINSKLIISKLCNQKYGVGFYFADYLAFGGF